MNQLSVDSINTLSPYKITQSKEGTYAFTTKANIVYDISFKEDMEIAGCPSYQFIINNLSQKKGGYDPFVKTTILAILYEFFDKNNDILLYICDTSDGREASRNRLFIRWFEQEDIDNRFTIRSANAFVEEEEIYTAIIVQNTHPHLKEIIAEFDYIAENLISK